MRFTTALLAALLLLAPAARAAPGQVRVRPAPVTVVGSPAEVALAAAKSVPLSPGSTLEHERTWHAPEGGRIVRLVQKHRGLPVMDAVVNVRIGRDGAVKRIVSSAALLPATPSTATIDRDVAIGLAKGAVRELQPVSEGRAALVVLRSGELAWHVPVPTILPHAYVVHVDATTGEVLTVDDRAKQVAQANVFPDAKAAFDARFPDRSFDLEALERVTLTGLASTAEGAVLNDMADPAAGLVGFNCCPTAGCDPNADLARVQTTLTFSGFIIPLDMVFCDERQTATADVNGDFLYLPATEPDPDPNIIGPQPSDGDPFAEVQAYNAARRMLEYMRTLDPQFDLGPKAQPLRVTANFLIPDFQNASIAGSPPNVSVAVEMFARFDNAMFLPAGALEQILPIDLPQFQRDFDSLIMGQGTNADFAYDEDVVAHELSHGTVNATAKFVDYARDDWGVTAAPGAMNEGLADFWAAALANDPIIGEYVGDLAGTGEGSIRRLDNDLVCPTVIRGEVHHDSQHFSAALWAARVEAATSAAARLAFDRGVLAAMRVMSPIATFDDAAALLVEEVEEALPGAGAKLTAAFAARKVTGCERFLDLTPDATIERMAIAPARTPWRSGAPAPLQFRLPLPAGTTSFEVSANVLAAAGLGGLLGGGGGQQGPSLRLLVKKDARLTFSYSASDVSSDKDEEVEFTVSGDAAKATVPFEAGCGAEVFVSVVNRTRDVPTTLADLAVKHTIDDAQAEACRPVEPPDAGADAGEGSGGFVAGGCGCGSSPMFALGLAGLLAAARRRRRPHA